MDKTQDRITTRVARAMLLFKLGNIFPRTAAVWEIVKKFLSSTEKEQPFLLVVDGVPGDPLLPFLSALFPCNLVISSALISVITLSSAKMLVLYETAMGYCLFKVTDSAKIESADLYKEFSTPEKASKLCVLFLFFGQQDLTPRFCLMFVD